MFLEVGGESGENRVGAVPFVPGLGEGRADAPDGLANAPGGLGRLINRAVVDAGYRRLKLGQFLCGDFLFLIGRIVALDEFPEPGHLAEVILRGVLIVQHGGALLDRGLALDPRQQRQGAVDACLKQ